MMANIDFLEFVVLGVTPHMGEHKVPPYVGSGFAGVSSGISAGRPRRGAPTEIPDRLRRPFNP